MKFSIIIPVKELNNYLVESIPHLLRLDYPKDEYEIIILPNDKPKYIPKYLKDKRIRVIPTGKISPAVKRDWGAALARSDILAFIDDDSYPQYNWLRVAEATFENLSDKYVAINGPAVTPDNATLRENMSGTFFESKFGGGATHRCRDTGRSFEIEDAPSVNLLVHREPFIEAGGFGSEYWPGDDSIFCQHLKDCGYKIWHQNNLVIFHHRRTTFKDHLKQVAGYGKHRGNFFRKGIGCSRKFIYLIPSIFLIGNLAMAIFWFKLWILLLYIYLIILSFNFCSCKRLFYPFIFPAAILAFVSHLTYGFSFINGFFTKDIRSQLR